MDNHRLHISVSQLPGRSCVCLARPRWLSTPDRKPRNSRFAGNSTAYPNTDSSPLLDSNCRASVTDIHTRATYGDADAHSLYYLCDGHFYTDTKRHTRADANQYPNQHAHPNSDTGGYLHAISNRHSDQNCYDDSRSISVGYRHT